MVEESFLKEYIDKVLSSMGVDECKWCLEVSLIDNKASYKSVIRSLDGDLDKLFEGFKDLTKDWKKRGIEVTLRKRNDVITVKAEVDLEDLNILIDTLFSYLPFIQRELKGPAYS